MTVRLRADIHLPTGDSLEIEQVAQDEFIRLNNYNGTPSVRNTEAGKTEWPLSETLAESGGAIFIVQGSKQTDTSLDRWEQINKRKIDPRVREQFKQKGGSLALEGRCNIIGELISGTEVLNRIAALPTDNTGHPLRRVRYSVSSK